MVSDPPQQYGNVATFDEIKNILREVALSSKETDRKLQESDKMLTENFRETDRKIKELSTLFTGQWGKLVEALMAPGCLKLFRGRGIDVVRCHPNVTVEKGGRKIMEIDLLLINNGEIVVVEIKTTARKQDIDNHCERLKIFKDHFPEYHRWKVYGAVAALRYEENSNDYAQEKRFFALQATGEGLVEILNPQKFKPLVF